MEFKCKVRNRHFTATFIDAAIQRVKIRKGKKATKQEKVFTRMIEYDPNEEYGRFFVRALVPKPMVVKSTSPAEIPDLELKHQMMTIMSKILVISEAEEYINDLVRSEALPDTEDDRDKVEQVFFGEVPKEKLAPKK